jgi:hypothetical protein
MPYTFLLAMFIWYINIIDIKTTVYIFKGILHLRSYNYVLEIKNSYTTSQDQFSKVQG